MKNPIKFFSFLLIALAIVSCDSRNQTSMKKSVTGNAGEIVIVISPKVWEAEPGQKLNDILTQSQLGLPQDEPILNVFHIPHEAYADIFRTSRNLMMVKIDQRISAGKISFKKDLHAHTQAVVEVQAKSVGELSDLFDKNGDKIVAFYLKAEKERLQLNYSNYFERAVSNLTKEAMGVDIKVPPGFKVEEQKENFMWIRYETPSISQGILIYSFPYESDSTFTKDYMIAKRNLILRDHVPGPTKGSYMSTENLVPVLYNVLKHDGNYASDMRGLWTVANDYMGGPFIQLAVLDLLKNRVVCLDGYVYAPGKDKRNLLRQVEAMIYTAEFTNQADIDKINKQFE